MKKLFLAIILTVNLMFFSSCATLESIANLDIPPIGSKDYLIEQRHLKTYFYLDNSPHNSKYDVLNIDDIIYFNIDQFKTIIQSIDYYDITKTDNPNPKFDFDTTNNKVTLSYNAYFKDYKGFSDEYNEQLNSAFASDMLPDFTSTWANPPMLKNFEITIDLINLGISFIEYENELYLPIHLLGFLYFGSDSAVYTDEETINIIDNINLIDLGYHDDLTINPIVTDDLNPNLMNYTVNFFNFLYQNFYVSYNNRSSNFEDSRDYYNEKFSNITDKYGFYTTFSQYLKDFEDFHIYTIQYGYSDQRKPVGSTYFADYIAKRNISTDFLKQSFHTKIESDTLYIYLPDFLNDYSDEIATALESGGFNNVVFDLRTNTGGYKYLLMKYLQYLSDDPIYTYYLDSKDNILKEQTTTPTNNFTNYNYYILSSGLTYSAGHYFTTIAKDNNLATIIGEQTLGGHSGATRVTLPDNTIISLPISWPALSTANAEFTDLGIKPDISQDFIFTGENDDLMDFTLDYISNK